MAIQGKEIISLNRSDTLYQPVCPQSILTLAIFSSFWQLNLYMNSDVIK